MKTIILKKLTVNNFKGIPRLEIVFNPIQTDIYGRNEAGKTTIADAVSWLFFGKNIQGQSDFDIKFRNPDQSFVHHQEHFVEGEFDIDGVDVVIKRLYREKWSKIKGDVKPELTGHTTDYFWDHVPIKTERDFKLKVDSIIPEGTFKLITNVTYFPALDWKERRQTLMEMAGVITESEILDGIKDDSIRSNAVSVIDRIAREKKTMQALREQIRHEIAVYNKDLDLIQPAIDENIRTMPEALDWDSIESRISECRSEIEKKQSSLADLSETERQKQSQISAIETEIGEKKRELIQIRQRISDDVYLKSKNTESELHKRKLELQTLKQKRDNILSFCGVAENSIQRTRNRIQEIETELEGIRKQWAEANALEFNYDECSDTCETCRQTLPESDIQTRKQNLLNLFKENKQKKIESINSRGFALKADKDALEVQLTTETEKLRSSKSELSETEDQISVLEKSVSDIAAVVERLVSESDSAFEKAVSADIEYLNTVSQIEELERNKTELLNNKDDGTKESRQKINETVTLLNAEISDCMVRLSVREQIKTNQNRISELEAKRKELEIKIANLERDQTAIQFYINSEIKTVESRVNSMFKYVQFRMFKQQQNGGEAPVCDIIVNGVEYSRNLNNAARINAGLDIIRTLSAYHGVSAPVFVDNAESVDELLPIPSQVVRLVVSKTDKVLRVVNS